MALLALSAKVDRFLQLSPNAARGWLVARSVLTVGWLPISVAPFVVRRDLFPRGLSSKDSHVWLCCMHRAESLSAPCSQSSRCLLWWWFWRPIRRQYNLSCYITYIIVTAGVIMQYILKKLNSEQTGILAEVLFQLPYGPSTTSHTTSHTLKELSQLSNLYPSKHAFSIEAILT